MTREKDIRVIKVLTSEVDAQRSKIHHARKEIHELQQMLSHKNLELSTAERAEQEAVAAREKYAPDWSQLLIDERWKDY